MSLVHVIRNMCFSCRDKSKSLLWKMFIDLQSPAHFLRSTFQQTERFSCRTLGDKACCTQQEQITGEQWGETPTQITQTPDLDWAPLKLSWVDWSDWSNWSNWSNWSGISYVAMNDLELLLYRCVLLLSLMYFKDPTKDSYYKLAYAINVCSRYSHYIFVPNIKLNK